MEEHLPTISKHSQKINLALTGFLTLSLLFTALSINQVRSIESQATSQNTPSNNSNPSQTQTASIVINQLPEVLRLGSSVTFTTTVPKLAGWEYPMVAIWCYQGETLVYLELARPNATFVLGGGSSDWKTIGGTAECTAKLYAYGSKGAKESIRQLAETPSFHAADLQ